MRLLHHIVASFIFTYCFMFRIKMHIGRRSAFAEYVAAGLASWLHSFHDLGVCYSSLIHLSPTAVIIVGAASQNCVYDVIAGHEFLRLHDLINNRPVGQGHRLYLSQILSEGL